MVNLKTCSVCKFDKIEEDFIFNSNECYKCVYARKIKMYKTPKKQKCKVCEKELPAKRWSYCSDECNNVAKSKNRHWTVTFQRDRKNYKNRFIGFIYKSNELKKTEGEID